MAPPSFPMGLYSSDWTTQLQGMEKEESSNNNNMNMTTSSSNTEEVVKCPRCSSSNTKFCYYNNYSLSQPRHFCKACKRYWTRGGTLRNVPVGGGCRKSKPRSKKSLTGMMTPTASHHHQLLNSHHMSSSAIMEFSQLTSRIGRLTSETLQALLFGNRNGNGNCNDDTHTNTNGLLGFSGLEEGYGFMGGTATSDSRSCLGYEQQLLNDYQPWSVRTYQNESPTETETETETLNVLGSLQALNAASSSCEAVFNDEWPKTATKLDPCGYNNSWNETECGYGDVLYPNKQDIYVSH